MIYLSLPFLRHRRCMLKNPLLGVSTHPPLFVVFFLVYYPFVVLYVAYVATLKPVVIVCSSSLSGEAVSKTYKTKNGYLSGGGVILVAKH